MDTLASLTHERRGGAAVFDLVLTEDGAQWWRHQVDGAAAPAGPSPLDVGAVRTELADLAPARLVEALRDAAGALQAWMRALLGAAEEAAMAGDLDVADELVARACELERERLRTLDELLTSADSAWDEAMAGVERVRDGGDHHALDEALRTLQLLWTERRSARRLLRGGP